MQEQMARKLTGFEASLSVEQTWPPLLVNVRGFKKVEFPVAIKDYETKQEEVQSLGPAGEI